MEYQNDEWKHHQRFAVAGVTAEKPDLAQWLGFEKTDLTANVLAYC
jgi:hypothetical protein